MGKRIIGDNVRRLLSKLDQTGGEDACWIFTGAKSSHGYGNFYMGGRYMSAHRAAYLLWVGEIPRSLEVDHACHDGLSCAGGSKCPHRPCANPRHLQLLSHRDNDLRGSSFTAVHSRKTHCPAGHEFNEENTYTRPDKKSANAVSRDCRRCRTKAEARRRARVKAAEKTDIT